MKREGATPDRGERFKAGLQEVVGRGEVGGKGVIVILRRGLLLRLCRVVHDLGLWRVGGVLLEELKGFCSRGRAGI